MKTFQEKLESFQPYLISIRYIEGVPVVDVIIKEGWTLPEDSTIKKVKGTDETINYYMLFSETPNVGLDEILAYLDRTIKLNIDKEKKHDLLRLKVNELKELFNKNNLTKLSRLKFTFGDEELVPSIDDLNIDDNTQPRLSNNIIKSPVTQQKEEIYQEELIPSKEVSFIDEKGESPELTDEDREIMEEEARAERNRKILETKKQNNSVKSIAKKVELPPKRKIEMALSERDEEPDCLCGPEEACSKCLDTK